MSELALHADFWEEQSSRTDTLRLVHAVGSKTTCSTVGATGDEGKSGKTKSAHPPEQKSFDFNDWLKRQTDASGVPEKIEHKGTLRQLARLGRYALRSVD